MNINTDRDASLNSELNDELYLLNQEIEAIEMKSNEAPDTDMAVELINTDEILKENPGPQYSYEHLREFLSQLNTGIFSLSTRLSSYVAQNHRLKSNYMECRKRLSIISQEERDAVQEKIKLQEGLDELQAKFDALEQMVEKVNDGNEDRKTAIERLRANRDRCVQTVAVRNKMIANLRNQATELRRQVAHFRSLARSRG